MSVDLSGYHITYRSVPKRALSALRQALSSEETISEAPFESILLPIWYVLALQQAVQTLNVNALITRQEALWHRVNLFNVLRLYISLNILFT